MGKYLLGIDIGTSACKVAVFREDGEAIICTSGEYPVYYPKKGWAEQNPNEWWDAVCQAIKKIFSEGKITPKEIAGIGVDGQSWSAILVDKNGEVLTNTPIWMDMRSKKICDRLNHQIGEDKIFNCAKNTLHPSYTTAKLLWYQEELPDIYHRAVSVLQSNSFIVFRLTGEKTTDKSQGYGVHCYDIKNMMWDDEMCHQLGIPQTFLPEIKESSEVVGYVHREAAAQTGLKIGTPVVAGGLDAACAALGAGVISAGETQEQGGQAGGMSICLDECQADPRLILSCHVVPGKWLIQGGTTGGGGAMRWFEREFADYERTEEKKKNISSLMQLNEIAEKVLPGSDGMIFLPYMAGERSPIWAPWAKGVYYGIDFSKTKGHFVRAIMEGVAYALLHNLMTAKERGIEVEELSAVGGAANSVLWTQIKADVTGKVIKVPSSDTAATLGAAILAGVGVGIYKDFEEGVRKTSKVERIHQPNQENHKIYQQRYKQYLEIYESLKETMQKQGGEDSE